MTVKAPSAPPTRALPRRFSPALGAGLDAWPGSRSTCCRGPLGIPADTAQFIAITFIVVGIGDAALLYFWDRLFKRGG